jgi:hypothetical protein
MAAVASVDPSSTTIASHRGSCCDTTDASVASIVSAAL